MKYPLAIFVPAIGIRSETFIRRHICDLLPGKTVAITGSIMAGEYEGRWNVDCPVLALDQVSRQFENRARRALRKTGLPVADISTKTFERFLKKNKVEVVLGEYLDQSLQWLPLFQRLGIRFFGHAHGYDVSMRLRETRWQKAYLRYNQSNGVITMSEVCRKRLINLGINESKVHVIPYGVTVPNKPTERLQNNIIRCLGVGRMVAKKAPILTLDAFRRACEAFPSLHLDYVGEGELLPAAQHFIRAFGLEKNVSLHKGQSNEFVHRLMDEADVFLQHSMTDHETGDEEGLPVAILEAMAKCLPVVSTLHAGIPEAVVNGVTGYLVNEGDSVAMAERIAALARDHHLRQQMGIAGWQRAKEHFTWEKERRELLRVMGLSPEMEAEIKLNCLVAAK